MSETNYEGITLKVIAKSERARHKIYMAIVAKLALKRCRFRARVFYDGHTYTEFYIKIENVRLKRSKHYCGQHPGPCPNNGFRRRHIRSSCLEGADWVGFNSMLNDVLDKLRANCDVFSYNRESHAGKYYIRRRAQRRVRYFEEYPVDSRPDLAAWEAGTVYDFEDHCGLKAPESEFTYGTPGFACWTLAAEKLFAATETAHS